MTVYVLQSHVSYEGSCVHGVFATREEAIVGARTLMRPPDQWNSRWRCHGEDLTVTPFTLGETWSEDRCWASGNEQEAIKLPDEVAS